MSHIIDVLQSAAAVVFTFGLVVFLHEFGHFIVARKLKVRVEKFSFGFGPELVGITRGDTRYSISAVPLGGFVKPAGENLEEATGDPGEYFSKTWYERLAIVAAGPAMNYVLAFTIFFLVVWIRGIPEPSKDAIIGGVVAGYPADAAGLQAEDVVVEVALKPVASWAEMAAIIYKNPGQPIELGFKRAGEMRHARVTPRLDAGSGRGLIGIEPKPEYHPIGMVGAAKEGAVNCWLFTKMTVDTLYQKIRKRERPDVAGPIGIVQMVSHAAKSGFDELIFLMGLLSVAVGFFNILPIPLLDGGHAALYIWEGLTKRKLTVRTITVVNSAGIVMLVSLLLFATYNDIVRIRQQRREARMAAEQNAQPSDKK